MKGETDEEKANNAKYVISIARKLGAVVFCVWEDIANVNYKMILVLVSSLFEIQQVRPQYFQNFHGMCKPQKKSRFFQSL